MRVPALNYYTLPRPRITGVAGVAPATIPTRRRPPRITRDGRRRPGRGMP